LKLKRFIVPGVVAGLIASALTMPIGADDGVITTTVTPLVLSVSVNNTEVDYGALPLSIDNSSRSKKVSNEEITATNNGSVTSNLYLRGSDATSAVPDNTTWTLDCTGGMHGTIGTNRYAHRFDTGTYDFDGGGEPLCSDPAAQKLLQSGVTTGGNALFKLQMNMPSDSTGYATRSSTVTVVAVMP
jgi:hypothetical protein